MIEICGVRQKKLELQNGRPYIFVHGGSALYALEGLRLIASQSGCETAVQIPFSVERDTEKRSLADKVDELAVNGFKGVVCVLVKTARCDVGDCVDLLLRLADELAGCEFPVVAALPLPLCDPGQAYRAALDCGFVPITKVEPIGEQYDVQHCEDAIALAAEGGGISYGEAAEALRNVVHGATRAPLGFVN